MASSGPAGCVLAKTVAGVAANPRGFREAALGGAGFRGLSLGAELKLTSTPWWGMLSIAASGLAWLKTGLKAEPILGDELGADPIPLLPWDMFWRTLNAASPWLMLFTVATGTALSLANSWGCTGLLLLLLMTDTGWAWRPGATTSWWPESVNCSLTGLLVSRGSAAPPRLLLVAKGWWWADADATSKWLLLSAAVFSLPLLARRFRIDLLCSREEVLAAVPSGAVWLLCRPNFAKGLRLGPFSGAAIIGWVTPAPCCERGSAEEEERMEPEPASLVSTAFLSSSDVRSGFLMGMRLVPKRLGASVGARALLDAAAAAAAEFTEWVGTAIGTDASSARLEANGSWSEAASTLPAAVDDPKMNLLGDISLDAALAGGDPVSPLPLVGVDPARPLPLVEVFPEAVFGRAKALVKLFKGLFTGLGSDTTDEGIWSAFEGGESALTGVPKGTASAWVEVPKGTASATRGVGDQFMGLPTGVPGVGCSDGSTSAWAEGLARTGPGVVGSLMTASTEEPVGTGAGLLIGVTGGGRMDWPLPLPPIRALILGCLGGLPEFLEMGVGANSAVASPEDSRLGMLAAAGTALGWMLCASLATSVSGSKEE